MELYPYPQMGGHPLSWVLLGQGVSQVQADRLMRHLVDDLGFRLQVPVEVREWQVSFIIDTPLKFPADKYPNQRSYSTGDSVSLQVPGGETTAVQVTGGSLPPGLSLDKTTGLIEGILTTGGVYSVTVTIGPRIKYDALGGVGGFHTAGEWIPVGRSRYKPGPVPAPVTTDDMTPAEIEQEIVRLQQVQAAKLAEASEVRDGD